MSMDAPDYQTVITLVSGGSLSDAPDWQEVVTGPGGIQPVGSGAGGFMGLYASGGFIGVTMDPNVAQNTVGLLGGTMYLNAFTAMATGPVHNVYVPVQTGNTFTAADTWAAIYDFGQASAGHFTLLASSASGVAAGVWASSGANPVAMATNPTLTAGQIYTVATTCLGNTLTALGYTLGLGDTILPKFANFPYRCNFGSGTTFNPMPATIAFSAVNLNPRVPLYYVD